MFTVVRERKRFDAGIEIERENQTASLYAALLDRAMSASGPRYLSRARRPYSVDGQKAQSMIGRLRWGICQLVSQVFTVLGSNLLVDLCIAS